MLPEVEGLNPVFIENYPSGKVDVIIERTEFSELINIIFEISIGIELCF